ncbi:MAG: hypothetical protein KAQ83_03270 [Nanoarchaeota archaeon]|nr:hypothetical protein [Nanoarchaeota archaeon]
MKITNLEQDFIQLFIDVGISMGLDEVSSKIFALLYLEPKPICIEKIADKLEYGSTSIYNKIKFMSIAGFIKKSKQPGSKKIYFYLRKDVSNMFKEHLILGYKKRILPLKEKIPLIIEKYQKSKLSKSDEEKLIILKDYNKQLIKMESAMKEIIKIMEKV